MNIKSYSDSINTQHNLCKSQENQLEQPEVVIATLSHVYAKIFESFSAYCIRHARVAPNYGRNLVYFVGRECLNGPTKYWNAQSNH